MVLRAPTEINPSPDSSALPLGAYVFGAVAAVSQQAMKLKFIDIVKIILTGITSTAQD